MFELFSTHHLWKKAWKEKPTSKVNMNMIHKLPKNRRSKHHTFGVFFSEPKTLGMYWLFVYLLVWSPAFQLQMLHKTVSLSIKCTAQTVVQIPFISWSQMIMTWEACCFGLWSIS
jgi:hypothetical protein